MIHDETTVHFILSSGASEGEADAPSSSEDDSEGEDFCLCTGGDTWGCPIHGASALSPWEEEGEDNNLDQRGMPSISCSRHHS